MDTTVSRPGASPTSDSYKRSSLAATAALLGFFLAVYLATVPGLIGDTLVYSGDILKYSQGGSSASPALLWEFGHVLWRPLGYLLWQLTLPLLAWWFGGNPTIEITFVLFAINFVSGAALTLLVFAVCRRLGLETFRAFVVTAGILVCDATLNWVHSGSAYVPGLALNLAALWLILRAARQQQHRALCCVSAGAALALAYGLWFPYVLSVPTALTLGLVAESLSNGETAPPTRERMRIVVLTAAAAVVFGVVVFLAGAAMAHVSTISEFRQWVINSAHGIKAERTFVRFPTGITRTFLYLGDEGTILKRFVFGDPYAHVRWIDLLGAGLWKVALVFVAFCVLFWVLLRTRKGRIALWVVLAGMLPTIAFAILLFETSGSERYFPFYPALIVGICQLVRQRTPRTAQFVLAIFLAIMAIVNLKAFAWDLRAYAKTSSERFKLVHEHTRHGGVALILSFRDPLSTYFQRSPFDPENRPNALPLFHVIEIASTDAAAWKSASSCRVMQAWAVGGEAWLSKRLVASRPQPDWQWAENDVNSAHWINLYGFFGLLDTDAAIGGADGFLRITRDANNQALLRSNCHVR